MTETIVDELVTNAIYNAPRDDAGRAKYAKMSRRDPVTLEDEEVGCLEFACDGDYIAISQVDPFGALTQDTIVTYLNRCLVKSDEQISESSAGPVSASIACSRRCRSSSSTSTPATRPRSSRSSISAQHETIPTAPKSFHIFVSEDYSVSPVTVADSSFKIEGLDVDAAAASSCSASSTSTRICRSSGGSRAPCRSACADPAHQLVRRALVDRRDPQGAGRHDGRVHRVPRP